MIVISKIKILVISICIIALLVVVTNFILNTTKNDPEIVTINGEKINTNEFNFFINKYRGTIYSRFKAKYPSSNDTAFWTTNLGGETPLDALKKETIEKLVEVKVQQILARELGIIKDISFDTMLKTLVTVNLERKKLVENKKPIYGPIEYTKDTYFDYTFSNMLIEVKRKLEEKELFVTDDEISSYYQKNKQLFKNDDEFEIEKKTQDGKTETINIGGTASEAQTEDQEWLLNIVKDMKIGEVLSVTDKTGQNIVLKYISKKEGNFVAFADAKSSIKADLIEKKYKEFIDEKIKNAVFFINEKNYKKITT